MVVGRELMRGGRLQPGRLPHRVGDPPPLWEQRTAIDMMLSCCMAWVSLTHVLACISRAVYVDLPLSFYLRTIHITSNEIPPKLSKRISCYF